MNQALMHPDVEYCFELRCGVERAVPLGGSVPGEGLHFARISGGEVDGPRLSGRVLDGGGDWWRATGLTVRLDARYVIEVATVDGIGGVEVVNRGVWRTDPATFDRILAGEQVAEEDLYYRTAFEFRTDHPDLLWLSESQFIGYARAEPGVVIIRVFRLR